MWRSLTRRGVLPKMVLSRSFCSSSRHLDAFRALSERGFVENSTAADMSEFLSSPRTIYLGIDPTASSLHLGNLVCLMALRHLQAAGHRPICLVGGATAMIGDPSGRSTERPLLDAAQVDENVAGITEDIRRVVDVADEDVVNNMHWYSGMSVVEYLREVGRHFRMGSMLSKESVRSRLDSQEGMSFTEFSYQTLQGYDFLHLHREKGCDIQIGGSDQWGNIIAGTDLVSRTVRKEVHGITIPLLLTASGEKFGKSAGNAVWMKPERTSPFQLYQYLLNTDDADVGKLLRLLTMKPVTEIDSLLAAHEAAPEAREAQRVLAAEVVEMLHGEEGVTTARRATDVLFSSQPLHEFDAESIKSAYDGVPRHRLSRADIGEGGLPIFKLAVESGACKSGGMF